MSDGAVMKSTPVICMLIVITVLPLLSESGPGAIRMVFVIDFDDFMCFSCLESFLQFCQSLPADFRARRCIGILTVPAGREHAPALIQIMRKKLRGFIKGNDIDFPVVVDQQSCFSELRQQASCVMVIQADKLSLNVHSFPLSAQTAAEIRALIQ